VRCEAFSTRSLASDFGLEPHFLGQKSAFKTSKGSWLEGNTRLIKALPRSDPGRRCLNNPVKVSTKSWELQPDPISRTFCQHQIADI
jgi:hypothetical protein